MARTKLVILLVPVLLVACTPSGMNDDDVTGDGGASRPPMTNGVSTLAGWANAGYLDGSRQVNLFNNPTNVSYGPDGKLYVADFDNGKLRVLDMDGNATTVISKTNFQRPFGMAWIGNTLFVSTDNDGMGQHDPVGSTLQQTGTIWRVDVAAKIATVVVEKIGRPRGLCALADGRLGVVDYAHHVIEIVDPSSGAYQIIAGTWNVPGSSDGAGAAATFNQPYACAQHTDGRLVVTDWANNAIRLVGLDGTTTTLVSGSGFGDGAISTAKFNHPQGIVKAKNSGDYYITDTDNYRVRKITSSLSDIATVAGDGTGGYKDDDNKLASQFYGLEGLSVKPDGSMIFVADGNRGESMPFNRIRAIKQ